MYQCKKCKKMAHANQQNQNQNPPQPVRREAEAEEASGKLTVRIPLYYGDGTDKVQPSQWARTLEHAKAVNAWTDKQTANAATEHFRARANTWRDLLAMGTAEEVEAVDNWPRLKALFLARFESKKTAMQRCNMIMGLNQGPNERGQDFFDRVSHAVKKCMWGKITASGEDAQRLQGNRDVMDEMILITFVNGLRPEIRTWVESTTTDEEPTLEDIKKTALAADSARRRGKHDTIVGAVNTSAADSASDGNLLMETKKEIQSLKDTISAMAAGRGQGGQRGGSGGRGRGGGGRGGGRGGGPASGGTPISQRDWVFWLQMQAVGTALRQGVQAHRRRRRQAHR